MTTPELVNPIPAGEAPHAYVAVQRYGSEWYSRAAVIHAQETTALADWRSRSEITLLPIVRDGDTGTRAIVEEVETLRAEVADFQAACKSACEQRDDLAARVTALQAAVDSKAGWRPPAREITDPAEADALPPLSIVLAMDQAFTAVDCFGRSWCAYGLAFPNSSAELLALNGGSVTVLWTPEEARDGE